MVEGLAERMPELSYKIDNLFEHGPLVDVRLSPGATDRSAHPGSADSHADFRMFVDPGCRLTMITPQHIAVLGLTRVGANEVRYADGVPHDAGVYAVHLDIMYGDQLGASIELEQVLATPMSVPHVGGLIGRDILRHAVFTYDGPDNAYTLTFPD